MTLLTPLDHHALLLFWLQLLLLFLVARGLGLLARRLRQPAVVGELAAGLLIGPSILGRLAPEAAQWLFPGDEVASGPLLAVAWVGVALLLVETGLETDLRLLSRIGRSTAVVPIGSLVVPLLGGIALGFAMPEAFLSEEGGRTIFALFIGVCLAVSSLPVVAKILMELGLLRRNVGQIVIVAGMVDDIIGWVMLSTLAGAVGGSGFQPAKLALIVLAIAGFVLFAATLGRRGADALLRQALRSEDGHTMSLSAVMLVTLLFAAVTQAIGIEAVFGAFVAGIVVSRSMYLRPQVEKTIHDVTHGLFAPIFFATAGMYVDLGALADPTVLGWAVLVIVAASVTKLVGSYVGARMGPLGHREALAVGIGLNARGALEVIIATIALSLGVFNQQTYTVIVLLAMVTSIAAPPLLRWALGRVETSGDEAERLAREELLESSVIAKATSALLPSRGGANSRVAARVLDRVLRDEAKATVLSIHPPHDRDRDTRRLLLERVAQAFRGSGRDTEERVATADDVAEAILAEAGLGYDLLALGLNEDLRGTHDLSPRLRKLLGGTPVPVLLVRRGIDGDHSVLDRPLRVLVPVSGTRAGRAAEEVAAALAQRDGSRIDLVHVLDHSDAPRRLVAVSQLRRARELSVQMGSGGAPVLRSGGSARAEIVAAADERGSDVIVLGAQLRSHEGEPFLGHGIEYVLEHARQTVVAVVFPDGT